MFWFYILMGIGSLFILFAGIYNWSWYWQLSRNKMFRNLIGVKYSRVVNMIGGIQGLSVALTGCLWDIFGGYRWLHYLRGSFISGMSKIMCKWVYPQI